MPLVTSENMLRAAMEGRYAVGAFNCENMEMVQAIVGAAEELDAPVILQTTPGTLRYGGLDFYYANVAAAARTAAVPVAIHLDHGESDSLAARALREGYTSIMIDGSQLPLGENIAITRRVVEMCAPSDIPVEGELGRVGGKEDDTESEQSIYTDPTEAAEFAERTGISSLAVGVGTAHGFYAEEPRLNVELISLLREMLAIPLVLHGASGLSDEAVRECIRRGMSKVNFATELRVAFTQAVRVFLTENPDSIDPKQYGAAGRDAVRRLVRDRIRVCGCAGKA